MLNKLIIFLISCFLALIIQCSNAPLAGGSDNPDFIVLGYVKDTNGLPAPKTIVAILTETYNPVVDAAPPSFMTDTTDMNGAYKLAVSQKGIYTVHAVDHLKGTRLLITGINITTDTSHVKPAALATPGKVKIALPSSGIDPSAGYVYVPGTGIVVFLNNRIDSVTIDSVPAGVLPVLAYSAKTDSVSITIRHDVPVVSENTTVVCNTSWKYSCQILLNTTSSGANVNGDVTHFPVLIRLNTSNFEFSQTQNGGADIRFTKPDNISLKYEIERWDSENKHAEIWVNADTVHGNNNSQYINMYWGNPDAADSSNSQAVFDTTNKFIAVWHMNEDPSTGTAPIKDRTVNAHNSMSFGSMTAANSIEGKIGKALFFDGVDDYLDAGNVSVPGNYSIGLWVLMDTLRNYQRFIYKDSSYTLWYDKDSVSIRAEHMDSTRLWHGLLQDGGTRVPMTTGSWSYLTATFDGNVIRLYKDGTEVSTSKSINIVPRTSSKPLWIGRSLVTLFVYGIMDEIRIEGTAHSADWIRLCYMNQMVDDKLTVFK